MKNNSNSKQEDHAPISDFNGHYQFLNNDHPSWVALDGILYPSISVAYQAARTDDLEIRQALAEVESYEKFKEIAMGITNSPDWNYRKYRVMEKLVRDKFKRSRQLGEKLASTVPRTLVNTFKEGGQNELFWGQMNGKGSNSLGKILMGIREQINKGSDWERWVQDQGVQNDEKMRSQISLIAIRDEKPIDKHFLEKKGKFFFGALPNNDFKLEHPSISKRHACIYFGFDLNIMLVDLGSSHGTTLTREGKAFKLEPLKPVPIEKGDFIIFGLSSRKYRVQIDSSKIQNYLKEKQKQIEEEIKEIANKSKAKSRSRSRSPKARKEDRK